MVKDRVAVFERYLASPNYLRGDRVDVVWSSDGEKLYVSQDGRDVPLCIEVETGVAGPVCDSHRLRQAVTTFLAETGDVGRNPVRLREFRIRDEGRTVEFSCGGRRLRCDSRGLSVAFAPEHRHATTASAASEMPFVGLPWRWNGRRSVPNVVTEVDAPTGVGSVFVRDRNLWIRDGVGDGEVPLTSDGDETRSWGIPDPSPWAPTGRKLVTSRVDYGKVEQVPIIEARGGYESIAWIRRTRPGGVLPETTLYATDLIGQRTELDVGGREGEVFGIAGWDATGEQIVIGRVTRDYKHLDLLVTDATTGRSISVLTEAAETFIAFPPFYPLGLKLCENGCHFVRASERDGWNHLYLYHLDGRLIRRLTHSPLIVREIVTVDEARGSVYFTATTDDQPYDRHLYRVGFQGGTAQRLTEGTGTHEIEFSPCKRFFIERYSNHQRLPTVDLRRSDGTTMLRLASARLDAPPDLEWLSPEPFTIAAEDGKTHLHGLLYKPLDFDESLSYPVIEAIYGGPQKLKIAHTFLDENDLGADVLSRALAAAGYIVVGLDGRGTPGRSKEFQDVVYRNFGRHEIPEHVAALKQLASDRPFMDLNSVGIFGMSWGGYMTIRALLLAPEFYRVGVATNPVVDGLTQAARHIEQFMDLPVNNPAGYEYASNVSRAQQLRGRLLLVHSTNDRNSPLSQTLVMAEALIRANQRCDLLLLPGESHYVSHRLKEFWHRAIFEYFDDHLMSEKVPSGAVEKGGRPHHAPSQGEGRSNPTYRAATKPGR